MIKNAREDIDYDCLNKYTILIFSFFFYLLSRNDSKNIIFNVYIYIKLAFKFKK